MPNTTLPTTIIPGETEGVAGNTEIVHAEINRLTRDTGWRDITSLLINGWTADRVLIRRVDGTGHLYFAGLSGASATGTTILDALAAFRPFGPMNIPAQVSGGAWTKSIRVAGNGLVSAQDLSTITAASFYTGTSYPVAAAASWPSSLPGSAYSA